MANDIVITQRIHRNRLRPYHIFATNSAWYYDPDDPAELYYYQRYRCHSCFMYDMSCALYDDRQGAQPARILFHNHRGATPLPPYLYTGTTDKYLTAYDCGNAALDTGVGTFGRCRTKDDQASVVMGKPALSRAVITGRHNDRVSIASALSDIMARPGYSYQARNFGAMAHAYTHIGYADPTFMVGDPENPPLDHYGTILRFAIDLPADAIILRARLAMWRIAAQTGSCYITVSLLDRDDMGEYVLGSGTEADNPRIDNGSGPTRLNIQGGDGNKYEIEIDSGLAGQEGWLELPTDIIEPLITAFIARPGYVPGAYIGIAIDSDSDRNTTTSNEVRPIAYRSDETLCPQLLISWREGDSEEHPKASTPPKLYAYRDLTKTPSAVPAEGTWPEELDGIDAGMTFQAQGGEAATKIPDKPWCSAYRHAFLLPVDPLLTWWDEETYGTAPYPEDAHESFCLDDCETYEVPCYLNALPFRYRSLGSQTYPKIASGLRGVVAFSSAPCQQGHLPAYYHAGGDCVVGGYHYESVVENTWRVHWGMTKPKKHVWGTDPLHRGWSITYTAYIRVWFVLDSEWGGTCYPLISGHSPGDPEACMFRWNTWYEVEIRAKVSRGADPNDAGFKAWVNTHAAGFGATAAPRYAHCNDVLKRCARQEKAMGDKVWPPIACQDQVEVAEIYDDDPQDQLCKQATDGYSWWYVPDWDSNHVKSPLAGPRVGAYPENLLYHEVKTVKKLDIDGSSTQDVYTWARLGFTTNLPWLLSADTDVPIQNAIHRLSVTNPNSCAKPPNSGQYRVGWGDTEDFWSDYIGFAATSTQVQEAIEAAADWNPGDIVVTGADGGPWDVEYVGWHGIDVEIPTLKFCDIVDEDSCEYSVSIEVVQSGYGG